MALLAAGTRFLLYNRSSPTITYNTTVGSPAVFDSSVVSGSVVFPSADWSGTNSVPYVAAVLANSISNIWVHADISQGGGYGVFAQRVLEVVDSSGIVLFRIQSPASGGNVDISYANNANTLVNVATGLSSTLTLTTYDIFYRTGANGGVTAYRGGAVWFDYSWANGTTAQARQVRVYGPGSSTNVSQFAISDGDDLRGFKFPSQVLTGNGTYNDGSGVPADTGDLNFTTGKGLPAATNKFTGTKPSYTFPSNAVIDGVMINTYLRTSGTPANARIITRLSGTDGNATQMSPAPVNGYVTNSQYLTLNPVTGLPWVAADYNSSEIGIEARS